MERRPSALARFLAPALTRFLPRPGDALLQAAQRDIQHRLRQAFHLASAQQRAVRIAPGPESGEDRLALRLPEGVRWGRPTTVPPPPDLHGTGWAHARPHALTILPRRRAAANVWFLHHGQRALCLRLGLAGQVEFLGYEPRLGTWRRV